jgi:hypothetical protein
LRNKTSSLLDFIQRDPDARALLIKSDDGAEVEFSRSGFMRWEKK